MTKTQSEVLFELYCTAKGIEWQRIPEGEDKTPDYELTIQAERIIVEVKEIRPNKEELESDRVLARRGYGNVLSNTPGDRVRKQIDDSLAQIKAGTLGQWPSILVLFDRGRGFGHVDPYAVRVAMYGLEQIHIAVPPLGRTYITGRSYGPKRKMTPVHSTSISAIGALWMLGPNQTTLSVYHNRFAVVPLDVRLLARYDIDQFELEDEVPGTVAQWKKVSFAEP